MIEPMRCNGAFARTLFSDIICCYTPSPQSPRGECFLSDYEEDAAI